MVADAVIAAGAVVLRRSRKGHPKVLVVHRPRYDDWSLPKGKLDRGETVAACAVREVAEETGLEVRLSTPMPLVRYPTSAGPKRVHYWRAESVADGGFEPNAEVDELRWIRVDKAQHTLSYDFDLETVRAAATAPTTVPIIVVRHGTAEKRKRWKGDDRDRPLIAAGRAEAVAVNDLLAPWAIDAVATSPAVRCTDTIAPYATRRGLAATLVDELSEELGKAHSAAVRAYVAKLRTAGVGTVISTHRPLLADIAAELDVHYDRRRKREPLPPGGAWLVHVDAQGGRYGPHETFHPTSAS